MFQARAFIDSEFGSHRNLHAELNAAGVKVPAETVYKWRQRGSIPGDMLAACLSVLEARNGSPTSVSAYMEAGKWAKPKPKSERSGARPSIFD